MLNSEAEVKNWDDRVASHRQRSIGTDATHPRQQIATDSINRRKGSNIVPKEEHLLTLSRVTTAESIGARYRDASHARREPNLHRRRRRRGGRARARCYPPPTLTAAAVAVVAPAPRDPDPPTALRKRKCYQTAGAATQCIAEGFRSGDRASSSYKVGSWEPLAIRHWVSDANNASSSIGGQTLSFEIFGVGGKQRGREEAKGRGYAGLEEEMLAVLLTASDRINEIKGKAATR
ncbi:hypothetical protein BHM03_00014319 [Ensete ventricosum]|uniref:Uncharacterized protein n=1 Tax=Ensete ventricosum TaxID=4639 RepID=A0A445ME91_ENSVE|nr:hypothetical protein BHM03_00014319 [Ensete ventricosum]